jgi:hypothetical protein
VDRFSSRRRGTKRGLVALLAAALLVPLAAGDAAAAAARPFFGVHVRSIDGGDWSRMRRANVGTVRTAFNFSTAKRHEHAAYDWDRFDRIVRGTAREGLALLPVLYGVPSWVPEARKEILEQPVRSVWRRYVEALVRRYGSGGEFWAEHPRLPYQPIEEWQVWNEPNSFVNWPEPDPQEYGRFLTRTARAIHRTDPDARVVSAGVIAEPINGSAERGARYLRRMFRTSRAARAADVIAVHPYARNVAAEKRLIEDTRQVMDRAGLEKMPLWVTEIGWGRKADQRKYLRRTLEMTWRQRRRLRIEGVVWYQWQDGPDHACGWCVSAGLIRDDGVAKALLRIYRTTARR